MQPGDICFPGGHREETDASFCATGPYGKPGKNWESRRIRSRCWPLDYFYGYSGPLIYPFAGILPAQPPLRLDHTEVEEVFAVPLKDLLAIHPVVGKLSLASRQEPGFPAQWPMASRTDGISGAVMKCSSIPGKSGSSGALLPGSSTSSWNGCVREDCCRKRLTGTAEIRGQEHADFRPVPAPAAEFEQFSQKRELGQQGNGFHPVLFLFADQAPDYQGLLSRSRTWVSAVRLVIR